MGHGQPRSIGDDAVARQLEGELRLDRGRDPDGRRRRRRRASSSRACDSGEQVLEPAQRLAAEAGVRLVPLWTADETLLDIRSSALAVTPETAGHVLLVEDDAPLGRSWSVTSRRSGFRVAEAGSAEEAADAPGRRRCRRRWSCSTSTCRATTGWDLLRGQALAAAGSPPVVITSATTVSPRRLARVPRRGLPAQALRRRDAGRRR